MSRKADPSLRERIVREAEHLLHLRGYHGTSLDDIARACKMTKANLLHHFRSKEALGLAVLDYKVDAYRLQCLQPLACCRDAVAGVAALFSTAAQFFRGNGCRAGCFVGNIALEMSDLNDRFREKAGRFFGEWTSALEARLRRDRAAGLFSPALDPRSTAESVLALYEGAIMLARTRRDAGVFERVGRQACRMLESHRSTRNAANKGGRHGTQNALRVLS